MITGELKNKIDSLWDIFAAGGLVNPLDVIEQITYLMFIHDLDDSDNLRAKEAARRKNIPKTVNFIFQFACNHESNPLKVLQFLLIRGSYLHLIPCSDLPS